MAAHDVSYKYDVFISHRWEDTGNSFTSFLYSALTRNGILAFINKENLPMAGEMPPNLLQIVRSSKISIPIISRGYAESECCLRELAEMVECYKSKSQIILPIFFDVEPRDVRLQMGIFAESFEKHKGNDEQTLKRWKNALTLVGEIMGYQLKDVDGNISKLVHLVVDWALTQLSSIHSNDGRGKVLISYRRKDTGNSFTSFLHRALEREGIHVIMNLSSREKLPNFSQTIRSSKILITVISKGYAESEWCLEELADMVECFESEGQKILPIFFNVSPKDVKKQTGIFEASFEKHSKRNDEQTLNRWKDALSVVGGMSGFELKEVDGDQSMLVDLVVGWALTKLNSPVERKIYVGLSAHVERMEELLNVGSNDVEIVGICGMNGIGKTTIAKALYNGHFQNFRSSCFLGNIGEEASKGLEYLQKQLLESISKREIGLITSVNQGKILIQQALLGLKVLLILDGVDSKNQLNAFPIDSFGPGSKIIITSGSESILQLAKINEAKIYRPQVLDPPQSLQLFSRHAFSMDRPPEDYLQLCYEVLQLTGGLPSSLERLGSFLYKKDKEEWQVTLQRWRHLSRSQIDQELKIWYDNPEDSEKKSMSPYKRRRPT
ncbi:hypothetical protein NE237_016310 [Protea cynaroides]|uniref:TIR domain-containing protein n=1 Tax=Protea cynaroides TaxID=273540 RepID=A0A9Q0GLG8_9MAGN|nr:hypothetical protein NE237_016310 [Protea cynaroides]